MTLNAKNLTNLTIAAVMLGLAAWVSMHVLAKPEARRVGIVEVGEIQ